MLRTIPRKSAAHTQSIPVLKKAIILSIAALSGWLVNLVAFSHTHRTVFHTKEATPLLSEPAKPPVSVSKNTTPKVVENPIKPLTTNQEVNNTVGDSSLSDGNKTANTSPPLKKRNYPYEASLIISPSDWPYVRSALIVANGFEANEQFIRWSNQINGHSGAVVLTGPEEDGDGCRQFRVTRAMTNEPDVSSAIAHVDFCRDGTMK